MVILALSLAASASVTQVVYNLSLPEGNLGTTHTYGSNPYELPAYGFQTNVAAPHVVGDTWTPGGTTTELWGKVTTGNSSETGLGLANDPDSGQHEIWDDNSAKGVDKFGFVVLDTLNLQQNPNLLYFHLQIGSAQQHEWFTILTSPGLPGTAGGVGTLQMIAGAANNDQTPFFTAPGWSNTDPNTRYIWIGAIIEPGSTVGHSNIVLDSETAFNNDKNGFTPEPGTLVMLGSGILGLGGVLRRKV